MIIKHVSNDFQIYKSNKKVYLRTLIDLHLHQGTSFKYIDLGLQVTQKLSKYVLTLYPTVNSKIFISLSANNSKADSKSCKITIVSMIDTLIAKGTTLGYLVIHQLQYFQPEPEPEPQPQPQPSPQVWSALLVKTTLKDQYMGFNKKFITYYSVEGILIVLENGLVYLTTKQGVKKAIYINQQNIPVLTLTSNRLYASKTQFGVTIYIKRLSKAYYLTNQYRFQQQVYQFNTVPYPLPLSGNQLGFQVKLLQYEHSPLNTAQSLNPQQIQIKRGTENTLLMNFISDYYGYVNTGMYCLTVLNQIILGLNVLFSNQNYPPIIKFIPIQQTSQYVFKVKILLPSLNKYLHSENQHIKVSQNHSQFYVYSPNKKILFPQQLQLGFDFTAQLGLSKGNKSLKRKYPDTNCYDLIQDSMATEVLNGSPYHIIQKAANGTGFFVVKGYDTVNKLVKMMYYQRSPYSFGNVNYFGILSVYRLRITEQQCLWQQYNPRMIQPQEQLQPAQWGPFYLTKNGSQFNTLSRVTISIGYYGFFYSSAYSKISVYAKNKVLYQYSQTQQSFVVIQNVIVRYYPVSAMISIANGNSYLNAITLSWSQTRQFFKPIQKLQPLTTQLPNRRIYVGNFHNTGSTFFFPGRPMISQQFIYFDILDGQIRYYGDTKVYAFYAYQANGMSFKVNSTGSNIQGYYGTQPGLAQFIFYPGNQIQKNCYKVSIRVLGIDITSRNQAQIVCLNRQFPLTSQTAIDVEFNRNQTNYFFGGSEGTLFKIGGQFSCAYLMKGVSGLYTIQSGSYCLPMGNQQRKYSGCFIVLGIDLINKVLLLKLSSGGTSTQPQLKNRYFTGVQFRNDGKLAGTNTYFSKFDNQVQFVQYWHPFKPRIPIPMPSPFHPKKKI